MSRTESGNTSQIDLRRMRTVVEVARAEAITTAAETLGLTQSAVSRTVAEVEDALGLRLFDRLPRGIKLTDAGQRFVTRAKRLLVDVDDLISQVREAPDGIAGRLRLGIASSGGFSTGALLAFARTHPDVAIETITGSAQALCPKLLHGELDLVIGSSSYLTRWRELEVTDLARMHFACMVRKDHPLARIDSPTELDVLGYPMILPESVEPVYSDIGRRYAHHGLPRLQPHYVTDNFDLTRLLVLETDAFFPFMHPSETFGGLDKHFLMIRDVVEMPPHHVSFARAAHRPRTPVAAIFEKLLVESLGPAESAAKA